MVAAIPAGLAGVLFDDKINEPITATVATNFIKLRRPLHLDRTPGRKPSVKRSLSFLLPHALGNRHFKCWHHSRHLPFRDYHFGRHIFRLLAYVASNHSSASSSHPMMVGASGVKLIK